MDNNNQSTKRDDQNEQFVQQASLNQFEDNEESSLNQLFQGISEDRAKYLKQILNMNSLLRKNPPAVEEEDDSNVRQHTSQKFQDLNSVGMYSSEEDVENDGQDSVGRNTEQERVGHKEEDKWTVDFGLLLNDHQLDVFPVFRTTACSVGKEYREGFHPFNEELNEPLFDEKISKLLKKLTEASEGQSEVQQ